MQNSSKNVASGSIDEKTAPKAEIVNTRLDDEIRRLIRDYGKETLTAAVNRLLKPRAGRPKANDWPELRQVFEDDAYEWLDGRDPVLNRSNYSVAKQISERHPGQSSISTHKRIERKLAKKPYDRNWYYLTIAVELSRDQCSWRLHIAALEALTACGTDRGVTELNEARANIATYISKVGNKPTDDLKIREVRLRAIVDEFGRWPPTIIPAHLLFPKHKVLEVDPNQN